MKNVKATRAFKVDEGKVRCLTICPVFNDDNILIGSVACFQCKYYHSKWKESNVINCKYNDRDKLKDHD